MVTKSRHFGTDHFRGISAVVIASCHFFKFYPVLPAWLFKIYVDHVMLFFYPFFIVSAVLLTARYRSYPETYLNPMRVFYVKRFFRIMPLWWTVLPIYYLLDIHVFENQELNLWHLFTNYIFIFGFFPGNNYNFTALGWSLFVEEWFYIFFPLIMLFPSRWILFLLLPSYWLHFACYEWYKPYLIDEWINLYARSPLNSLYLFVFGVAYWGFMRDLKEGRKLDAGIFLAVSSLVLIWAVYRNDINAWGSILLFVSIVTFMNKRVPFLGIIRKIGFNSYAYYLIHGIIIQLLFWWFPKVDSFLQGVFLYIVFNLTTYFFAEYSTKYYEAAFHRLANRYTGPMRPTE